MHTYGIMPLAGGEAHPVTPDTEVISVARLLHADGHADKDTHHREAQKGEPLDAFGAGFLGSVVSGLFEAILFYTVASIYKSQVLDRREPFSVPVSPEWCLKDQDFKYPLLSCFDDCNYCMMGCFCNACREADTYAITGVEFYWKFQVLFLIAAVSGQLADAFLVLLAHWGGTGDSRSLLSSWVCFYGVGALYASYLAGLRQKLREHLGGQPGKYGWDFCAYWCCGCCAAIQNARQVDEASGKTMLCCCTLAPMVPAWMAQTQAQQAVVGQPVHNEQAQPPPAGQSKTVW